MSQPSATNYAARRKRGMNIQRRIPLLIGALLFFTILSFTLFSYFTARNIALQTGRERLKNLTDQLATLFGQSAKTLIASAQQSSNTAAIKAYLQSGRHSTDSSVRQSLDRLRPDSTWLEVQLLNPEGQVLLCSPAGKQAVSIAPDSLVRQFSPGNRQTQVGHLYRQNDSIVYPVISPVLADSVIIGYVLRWRLQAATAQSIAQFSKLLGAGATLYVGNTDSSLWTDLNKAVNLPVQAMASLSQFQEYDRQERGAVLGMGKPIPHTPWLLLIELSRSSILAPASQSLQILLLLGGLLLLAGFIITWFLSRRITHPIKKLTAITTAIAQGDYSQKVDLPRNDELGQLASAYNSMLDQVNRAQQIKEKEVRDRTAELNANLLRLQESEDRFRSLLESAPDAMIIADRQGRIILVNKQAESLFGYDRQELLGQPVEMLVPPATGEKHQRHRNQYYHEPKFRAMGAGLELYAVRKNGSSFPVEISLAPLETSGGLLVSAAVRDITQRKQADEEIRLLNKELESFTYSVSHDLRSPLRIIDGYADMLVEDFQDRLGEEGNQSLQTIKKSARRMGQLIDDLLNLSHIGRKELSVHPADMNRLVAEVVEEQQALAGKPVTVNLHPLAAASCDSGLIRQVWTNLIGNAIKYSAKQENPVIEISSSQNGRQVVYQVKDNGVGFDMKYADKLFGVFQRLHKVTEFEGTGIGLALSNRVILKHGGKIWAQSQPGQGASFWFSLPKE